MIFRRTCLALGCLAAAGFSMVGGTGKAVAADKPARIVAGLSSADDLISDLEYLVSKLAGQKGQWEKNVYPNLEVFLIGVDTSRPVRLDTVVDAQDGKRSVFVIPVNKGDLPDFRDENLTPIGIDQARVPGDPTLWELTGDVLEPETWWMRHAFEYATLSKSKLDVAKDIEDPAKANESLFAGDKKYDVAVQLLTTQKDQEGRLKAVKKLREESAATLKEPRDGESKAAFELRKFLAAQQLDTFETIFAESSELFVGYATDSDAGKAFADVRVKALEGTDLEKNGSDLGTTQSIFASIPESKDPVFKGRANIALAESLQKKVLEFATLSEPTGHERIDKDEKKTPEQKAASKKIVTTVREVLKKNADLGVIDAFMEITKLDSGKHALVAGLRAKEGAVIKTIVEQLPIANDRWTSKLSIETVEGVEIHQLTSTKPTDVVKEFWGSGDIYIGAGPETVWLAKGQGSLEVLKAAIVKQKEKAEAKDPSKFVTVRFHAKPILYINESFWDEMNIDISGFIEKLGLFGEKKKDKPKPTRPGQKAGEQKSSTRDQIKNFKWAEPALAAMEGKVDVIDVVVERKETSVEATLDIQLEVLKAAGSVIAEFARQNLQ